LPILSGKPLASVFTVTGNGSDELFIESRAELAGQSSYVFGCEIVAVPIDALLGFFASESANGSGAITTPANGAGYVTIGTPLSFTATATDFISIWTFEVCGNGSEVVSPQNAANEYVARVLLGPTGSPTPTQQACAFDAPLGFGGGDSQESFRYVALASGLTPGNSYTLSAELDGTASGGNLFARRIRQYVFDAASIDFVLETISTSGFSGNPGAGGTQNLPGAQLAIPDPGENGVLHTFLACIEAQLANFVT